MGLQKLVWRKIVKNLSIKIALTLAVVLFLITDARSADVKMINQKISLPKTVNKWSRGAAPRIVDSSNIFDYMNGGGELYLAYRFDQLEVFEYTAEKQAKILVEIYYMKSAEDAFGLLSLDWSGDPMIAYFKQKGQNTELIAPSARSLYGMGLLRLSAGRVYSRVLSYLETPESREVVLSLGRMISEGRQSPEEPYLIKNLPTSVGQNINLRRDRIGFFRSHLVLNSLFYISHQNILDLDLSSEAVAAQYEIITADGAKKGVQLVLVKYSASQKSKKALERFHQTYLSEHKKETAKSDFGTKTSVYQIEDGWLGYKQDQSCLTIAFGCPDAESAHSILKKVTCDEI